MKFRVGLSLMLCVLASIVAIAQEKQPVTFSPAEQEIIDLSNCKWQWMSEKNVEQLSELFHDTAQFVHMGGYWGKDAELNTIKSGAIWYKKAEIHNQEVKFTDSTATVYSVIHLNSEVGGNSVRFPFIVTEIYIKENGNWKLSSLVFTKTLGE